MVKHVLYKKKITNKPSRKPGWVSYNPPGGGGEGVRPYMGYIGMCHCEGYGRGGGGGTAIYGLHRYVPL